MTESIRLFLEQAEILDAEPRIVEENCVCVRPKSEYDKEKLEVMASKEKVKIIVDHNCITQLEASRIQLDELCMILGLSGVDYDVVGINKKLSKYRIIIFPEYEQILEILKKDLKKFDLIDYVFEKGVIQASDNTGELDDNSERFDRMKQKEEMTRSLVRWGIEYQLVDEESIEIYPTSHHERQQVQLQLKKYSLVNIVFKTEKYKKIPMSTGEKREIVRDLANKFRKYGKGYLEMSNAYTIVAYAKNKKFEELYKKIFSEYWYRYVEVGGEVKALRLVVEPMYKNGEMYTQEEWMMIKHKLTDVEASGIKVSFPSNEEVLIRAKKFEDAKSIYWIKNYTDRKVEADNEKGYVYTKVQFKFDE